MAMSRVKYIFQKYPLLANSAVYGGMCVTAEFSQQMVNKRYFDRKEPPEPIDKAMLVRYAVVGSCINSNILYFWYRWLDRNFVGASMKIVTKKLLLDQFVLTPQLLTIFYVSMSIMEGKDDLLAELREKFVPTFQTSCGFWLPAQAINFLVVPPMARVVYVATCSFIWVNILCWIKRTELKSNPS
ncbi:mpv17-like protein isoform X1 [Cimex lectularius]|uniref:Mpv17-like protein n=1 Tax=Cimex lectularius TaxID=79782 RepID=A0A8I6TCC5_CIMLE|nr:mpv17-like protein isoform X1 [Cimex lectularius]